MVFHKLERQSLEQHPLHSLWSCQSLWWWVGIRTSKFSMMTHHLPPFTLLVLMSQNTVNKGKPRKLKGTLYYSYATRMEKKTNLLVYFGYEDSNVAISVRWCGACMPGKAHGVPPCVGCGCLTSFYWYLSTASMHLDFMFTMWHFEMHCNIIQIGHRRLSTAEVRFKNNYTSTLSFTIFHVWLHFKV